MLTIQILADIQKEKLKWTIRTWVNIQIGWFFIVYKRLISTKTFVSTII